MSKEYIEKEALLAQVRESRANNTHLDSRDRHAHDTEHRHFEYMVFSAKPADVKPVVRGEWLCEGTKCRIGYNDYEYWNKWRCSCCGYIRTEGWEYTSEGQEPKDSLICENCGADMRPRENLKAGAEYADADTMMPAT